MKIISDSESSEDVLTFLGFSVLASLEEFDSVFWGVILEMLFFILSESIFCLNSSLLTFRTFSGILGMKRIMAPKKDKNLIIIVPNLLKNPMEVTSSG